MYAAADSSFLADFCRLSVLKNPLLVEAFWSGRIGRSSCLPPPLPGSGAGEIPIALDQLALE